MVQGRKMRNYGPNQILDLNTSFERYFYKLSENHKIFEIRSTVRKLWPLKDVQLQFIIKYSMHPHPLTPAHTHTHTLTALVFVTMVTPRLAAPLTPSTSWPQHLPSHSTLTCGHRVPENNLLNYLGMSV